MVLLKTRNLSMWMERIRLIVISDKFDDNCQKFAKEDVTLPSIVENAIE